MTLVTELNKWEADNPYIIGLDGFEFSPRLDDTCQYSTLFRGDRAIATLQRGRVTGRTGPAWTLYATDGALIAKRWSGGRYSGVAKWAVTRLGSRAWDAVNNTLAEGE